MQALSISMMMGVSDLDASIAFYLEARLQHREPLSGVRILVCGYRKSTRSMNILAVRG
jgi:hypothetical protein